MRFRGSGEVLHCFNGILGYIYTPLLQKVAGVVKVRCLNPNPGFTGPAPGQRI